MKKKMVLMFCCFLNALALTAASSYSFVGPYEPKKPEQLMK